MTRLRLPLRSCPAEPTLLHVTPCRVDQRCVEQRSAKRWRANRWRFLQVLALLCLAIAGAGCGSKKNQSARQVPAAPALPEASGGNASTNTSVAGIHVDPHAKVLWSETGYASWYGPNYNKKRAANGEIYDQNQLTAAHNTLPLNSIVRVVNLKNNRSTIVRITDRGPFVGDRIIDLSVAAAKAVNVYLPGTAKVRLEVLEAPRPIETGGRWCVQIGALPTHSEAIHLKKHLMDRYSDSQVIEFQGPTGYWVRLRMPQDDKEKTRKVFAHTQVKEGGVFMVRLD